MKIVYIHQYFKTYSDGGSSRSYYLAKSLVDNGFDVELITSHNSKDYLFTTIEGIKVHYLPVSYDNHMGFFDRIWSFLSFMFQAYKLTRKIKNIDSCYVSSTPLTVGITALLLKWQRNIPYHFEVRDLWPLAPIQLGIIKNRWLQKFLSRLEQRIYEEATSIIALSPGIASHIQQCVPYKTIHLLPNISDCDFFQKEAKKTYLTDKYDTTHKFVVTYFGAIGQVNNLQSLIEVAKTAQEANNQALRFLIVGRGNQLAEVQKLAKQYQLTNILFIPHVSKYQLREIINITDAVYVSFASYPVLETSSPNKFFDTLASGKLCITNTSGWIAQLIEEYGCGFYANPTKPEELLTKVSYYMADPEALEQAQYNARRLAETQFSREHLTQKFIQILDPSLRTHTREQHVVTV
ncbi:glycosyltransferase family 4 protein [Cytophagaceae bacterium DM2B3-1]|uniref:Glycosyltransferase family 4 protein n=1 Tax=Xanthocytophaga flava TaxID=3048013 RepID=A0ABT7CD45_9BACT|nr:glycosyltransferase family 4 protein [Xanthocytophaga flavus]MDJ1491583.1 glycosyltransferase family 4 protein [Xanthocytophaga flavus]